MIGEFLYRLTPSELHSDQVVYQRQFQYGSSTAAATSIDIELPPIPGEKVGLITNIAMQALPGAGQTTRELTVSLRDEANNFLGNIAAFIGTQPVAILTGMSWQFQGVLIFPKEHIRGSAQFSAGGVANFLDITVHILLIPKGTLQLR